MLMSSGCSQPAGGVYPYTQIVDVGGKATMVCISTITPSWEKDSVPLYKTVEKEFPNKYILKIKSITEDDAGVYTCVIKNEHGNFRANSKLYVGSKITIEILHYQYSLFLLIT